MKTVRHIKKLKKGFEVTFDEDVCFIQPEIYIKYHLKPGLEIKLETYEHLINENDYLTYYQLGLQKLKTMQTIQEMRDFLALKGAKPHIIKQIIHQMMDKNYLNDLVYTKTYIALKKHQQGPQMIAYKLKEKGISQLILDQEISEINEQAILFDIVPKKLKSKKNKPYLAAAQSVKQYFMQKGFSQNFIDRAIYEARFLFDEDETALIEKEFEKLHRQYQAKLSGYPLTEKITQKLYQKGFRLEDIKTIVSRIK